jgi:polyisoprenoid-binding protein YceI
MSSTDTTGTGTSPAPAALLTDLAGQRRLDADHTTITFHTRHLFGLAAVGGTMRVHQGLVSISDEGHATGAITIDADSFDSGNTRRDTDVAGPRFLDAEQYPLITFRPTRLVPTDHGWRLDGDLTVRAKSQKVSLSITSIESVGDGLRVRCTARIDRYAFGLTAARGMAARHLDLSIDAKVSEVDGNAAMSTHVLLVGRQTQVLDDVIDDITPQVDQSGLVLHSATDLPGVRGVMTKYDVEHVIMGAGLGLPARLSIVEHVQRNSDHTTVHLKDRASGPEGMAPFARAVLATAQGPSVRSR